MMGAGATVLWYVLDLRDMVGAGAKGDGGCWSWGWATAGAGATVPWWVLEPEPMGMVGAGAEMLKWVLELGGCGGCWTLGGGCRGGFLCRSAEPGVRP